MHSTTLFVVLVLLSVAGKCRVCVKSRKAALLSTTITTRPAKSFWKNSPSWQGFHSEWSTIHDMAGMTNKVSN
jgi:hypothetical protein